VTVKSSIRGIIHLFGLEITRASRASDERGVEIVKPTATHAPWSLDARFLATYHRIRSNTMVDIYRCYELWMLVEQVAKVPGDIVEIGVWRGGTGALLADRSSQLGLSASVYLCDTFRGMVKTGPKDPLYRGGELSDTSAAIVRDLVGDMELGNVKVLQGIFPDETAHEIRSDTVRLCHIDVDVYESAQDIVAWVWPKLSVGGLLVYDDYGFPTCAGITTHVDEQRSSPDRTVIHNLNGHAIVVKLR
jgi:O-methyltransferase